MEFAANTGSLQSPDSYGIPISYCFPALTTSYRKALFENGLWESVWFKSFRAGEKTGSSK
jgi:hypothetical protein